ncbi:type II toxin-antitoxin system prevent-host-death family antitoxin [Spirosoma foliorum]|uniref:Type II toxin-antitoxin system prevent-host-death family antitoxin n=1 Tax=Spirosoma foliorum TaxID=2710596 RepID=A0A7G5GWU4_9BACT|nr:type II toxin-antitoxin system prevent-host-death family antitoxin [Spirosoma foliorum]QMW03336.1 type II toxin-antitoxin system prevent-host-death family antitoxin [Spirosoma foliorum]
MEKITANDFRRQVGEYLNRTYYAKEQFVIIKSGKQIAALVPISILERLTQLEEPAQPYVVEDKEQSGAVHTDV